MMLSRLALNPKHGDVRRSLRDSQAMHRLVMSLFGEVSGGDPRATLGVLHRVEVSERDGSVLLLVQSRAAPNPARWPTGVLDAGGPAPSTKSMGRVLEALAPGARFRFLLVANPTRKVDTKTRPDGTKSNGRRVALRGEDEHLDWIARKGVQHGFRVAMGEHARPLVRVRPVPRLQGWRRARMVAHDGVVFEGLLSVVDAGLMREALVHGIGSAKAYGMGLLSLAPAASSVEG